MAVDAIIKDGVVQETMSQSSVSKANASQQNGMDKDAFLQLLVAQMKYQDPLQPTSNTEYISQYATFSQVEQMQNMAATMELTRASSMVGKLVTVESTDAAGETKQAQGIVEYVSYENNKAYVSIDGTLYSADDVVAVVDENYQAAFDLATAFAAAMNELPPLNELTVDDKEIIDTLQAGFNGMTAYQQSFVANAYIEKLQSYVERMAELVEIAEELENAQTESETTDETDKVEEVEETTGVGADASEDAGAEVETEAEAETGTGEAV